MLAMAAPAARKAWATVLRDIEGRSKSWEDTVQQGHAVLASLCNLHDRLQSLRSACRSPEQLGVLAVIDGIGEQMVVAHLERIERQADNMRQIMSVRGRCTLPSRDCCWRRRAILTDIVLEMRQLVAAANDGVQELVRALPPERQQRRLTASPPVCIPAAVRRHGGSAARRRWAQHRGTAVGSRGRSEHVLGRISLTQCTAVPQIDCAVAIMAFTAHVRCSANGWC